MYILQDDTNIRAIPRRIKSFKSKPYIQMECILQTANELNRNKRSYDKQTLQESINKIMPRIKGKEFVGELDHPVSKDPGRQLTVLYKECSHVITELGWDGNSLIGVLETTNTPNGQILKGLAEQGIPVGFSYRGMGDLRPTLENGQQTFKVVGPLHTVTWDSVSFPSHPTARMTRISEGVGYNNNNFDKNASADPIKVTDQISKMIFESIDLSTITENRNNYICTENGVCYLPNDFDKLVELRKKHLLGLFR
jgi:hypothetical protein